MKFNDTSNTHDSLSHFVNDILGVSNNEYALAWKARSTNTEKHSLALEVWRNQDAWNFDDSANTDFPISTATLVDAQQDYQLPTDALEVVRVAVLDSSGNYQKLLPIDDTNIEISLDEFEETDGMPRYYRLFARSIFLYPAPASANVTTAAGLKVTYHRQMDEFTAATTTTEIGFDEPGDRVIAYAVAYEFAAAKSLNNADRIKLRLEELRQNYLDHIAKRTKDMKPRIRVAEGRGMGGGILDGRGVGNSYE